MWRSIIPYRDGILVKDLTWYIDTKKRGIVLLSIPRVEAPALPIVVEQTTLEPTPIWKSLPLRDLYNTMIASERVQSILTRSPRDWYNHTQDIYRWPYSRQQLWICKIRLVSNTASDKRLLYVLTLSPSFARLLPRKLFGLLSFQLGVGCLLIDIEKTQFDIQIRESLQR